jgi:hypothetical protein
MCGAHRYSFSFNALDSAPVAIRLRLFKMCDCGVLQHFPAIFDGGGFREALEDATEIRRIAKSAANGNVFKFEIVMAQEEFAARNADVGQVIDERHVTMTMKHAREMVGADGEEMRHGIACDVVLIVALQINTDALEKTLAAIFSLRGGGFVDQSFDT